MASLISLTATVQAGVIALNGELDPSNPNSVALFSFTLSKTAVLDVQTFGYGGRAPDIPAGGFDPMLSLFAGTGDAAGFLAANDDGDCPPGDASIACHDATLRVSRLAAGSYTLALSVFGNFALAGLFGGGTLADGFAGLGSWYDRDSGGERGPTYALEIRSDGISSLPEPAFLFTAALAALAAARRRQPRT